MTTQHIDAAYKILRTAVEGTASKGATTKMLDTSIVPELNKHMKILQAEVSSFQKHPDLLDIKSAPVSLQEHVRELRNFLVDTERRLNGKSFKNVIAPNFGSDLKKKWMTSIFKNADDVRCICELTDATSFQNEQARVVHAVRTSSIDDGAKEMLAQSKVSLTNSSQGPARQLLHVMAQLSNAARYELLSKVDLYIRSGHAQNDLASNNKETKKLRTAFSTLDTLNPSSQGYTNALALASEALYARFDDLFQAVSVRADKTTGQLKTKNHGTLASNHKEYAKMSANGTSDTNNRVGYACERIAPSGYIDSVIISVDKKTIFGGLVTANDKSTNLVNQGEQLAKQLTGLLSIAEKDQRVDITSIMRATHHTEKVRRNSNREEFFHQMGVDSTDTSFVGCLDKLQALTVLCALPNAEARCKTRFLLVGKELNWDPSDYDAAHLPTSALNIIQPIIEKMIHSDFHLRNNSTKDSLVNQVAQNLHYVVSQFKDSPEMRSAHDFFQKASSRLDDIVNEAKSDKSKNIAILDIEQLAMYMNSVKAPILVQTSSMDMA